MFKHLLKQINRDEPGFSLIEVLAVLFIITIGLVGLLSLILQNIQVKDVNKSNLVARQLAQEGIELVRRKRDTNWLQVSNCTVVPSSDCWKDGITAGTYKVSYEFLDPIVVSSINETQLTAFSSGNDLHFYGYNGSGQSSPFHRLITITEPDTNSLLVIATVQWDDRGQTYSYSAETLLYDWY